MLIDPTKSVVSSRKPGANAAPGAAPQKASMAKDQLQLTRRQTFITMSDGHSADDRLPQVATVVNETRKQDPHTLVFYGGDAIIGTPYYPAGNNGEADMKALNKLGVASFVIGNHDLDAGYDHFVEIAKAGQLPFVVANWDIQGPLADLQRQATDPFTGAPVVDQAGKPVMEKAVQPYRIFTNPETGLKTVSIGISINPKDYGLLDQRITYKDPAESLKAVLAEIQAKPELKDALVVVQTHLAAADAEKLEAQFGDKVFFAAHDHTSIAKPVEATVNGAHSYVTDTGGNYRSPGIYRADVGPGGTLAAFDGGLVPIDATVPKDPAMLEHLAPLQAIVDRDYNTPIANLTAPILRAKLPDQGDSVMGDWIADNVKESADKFLASKGLPPTDVALINATGIRTDFPKAGPITAGDIYRVFPFDNSITVVTLTAEQLQAALDNSAKRAGDPIAGATADLSTEGAKNVLVNGKPIGAQPTYRVAALDFMVDKGGSGYHMLAEGTDKTATGVTMRGMLTDKLRAAGTVSPPEMVKRMPFVAPKPQVGPPPPPPNAATDTFVGTWTQRISHYLGKDGADTMQELKTAVIHGVVHL